MASRRAVYFEMTTRLALMDDRKLGALLRSARRTRGWGSHRTLEIDGTPAFAKSIPITDREYAHAYSTRNLYRLPGYYQYGVGSAGFGVFREIAAHVKTANWVLGGSIASFPLMYHHRILPASGRPRTLRADTLDRYVTYWNGSRNIRRYIVDRQAARYEAVIFLEHVPHVMSRWIPENMSKLEKVVASMQETIRFMQEHGLIHFDAHWENILSDGSDVLLADFGLALDAEFDLSGREREFLRGHRHYDHGELALTLLAPLESAASGWSREATEKLVRRYGKADPVTVLENAEDIAASGDILFEKGYLDLLLKYRDVILVMERFFTSLHTSPKKSARYVDRDLVRLLREVPGGPIAG